MSSALRRSGVALGAHVAPLREVSSRTAGRYEHNAPLFSSFPASPGLPRALIESHALYYEDTSRLHTRGLVLGYVTPWNRAGYDFATTFRAKFTHISPVWYQVRRDAQSGAFLLTGAHDVDTEWLARLRAPEGSLRLPKIVPRVIFELNPMDTLHMTSGIDASGRPTAAPGMQAVFKLLKDELDAQGRSVDRDRLSLYV